jgi:outer membrane protein TolC
MRRLLPLSLRSPLPFVSPARGAAVLCAALLAACTVGPDYQAEHTEAPAEWRTDSYWHVAAPSHAPLALDWWLAFSDATLAGLETQALAQNQTLAAAVAHYEQAKATLASTSGQQVPQVGLSSQLARQKISKNRPLTSYTSPNQSTVQNLVEIGPSINYDTDLFGRIRSEVEGATASAEQSRDDLANARLVLTTELATAYY